MLSANVSEAKKFEEDSFEDYKLLQALKELILFFGVFIMLPRFHSPRYTMKFKARVNLQAAATDEKLKNF